MRIGGSLVLARSAGALLWLAAVACGGEADGSGAAGVGADGVADVGSSAGADDGDVLVGGVDSGGADGAGEADASVAAAAAGGSSAASGSVFPAVTDLTTNGPFVTNSPQGEAEGPSCMVHRPAMLGEDGVRHPVIIWGMGTGGFNTYQGAFDLWASNGFIVAAATQGDGQGDGVSMLACLDYVCEQYAADVDCRAGASGHSQGGGGAIMIGQDSRVITTAPVQPYIQQGFGGFDRASITNQTGPMLLLSGTDDTTADPPTHQQPVFEMTNVPVLWANSVGTDHIFTGIDGIASYREIILAWFRVQLMGDDSFRGMFYAPDCSVCSDGDWLVMPSEGL